MDQFWFYFNLGFSHVLDINGLDHFYFLIALSLPLTFKEIRKLIWWVTLFTIGHTFSLFQFYKNIDKQSESWIEFLIPISLVMFGWLGGIENTARYVTHSFPIWLPILTTRINQLLKNI